MAWYIELLGAAADLEEFPRRFVAGAIHATQRDGSTFLTGSHFDQFEKPADVVQAAENFLFKSTAIVSLEWLAVKLPTIGRIQRQIGNRIDHHVLLVGLESRMKMGEVGVGGSTQLSVRSSTSRNGCCRIIAPPRGCSSPVGPAKQELASAIPDYRRIGSASR